MDPRLKHSQLAWMSAAGLLFFFGLWTFAAWVELAPRRFLPLPWEVLERGVRLLAEPFSGQTLQAHLAASIERYLRGFLLAAAVGVPLGLLMGWYRWLDNVITPLFDSLRFIAPIAWVPFAALWFGTGVGGPTLIIFAGAFPPCLINAYRGARYVERKYIEAAQVLGASGPRIIYEVLLPASLPSTIAGLRVSAGAGWQSLIGAELIAANSGIGLMMVRAQGALDTSIVMVGMIAVGVFGLLIDVALRGVEGWVQHRRGR
ncbi:ABC transporter permease [Ramlibacter tataouinensis]|uniref:Candidate ABC type nitrate/sulfonate/bicarbonate transport system, permease component n=1 Tax=Ramlibacter tataouinensis (strain ATCC BAA-407 / DSM 14655 / LMG 21543 / TTB310) TaxID=365046 RepID=F5Y4H7_RAMTT|nr:ABC transporter permease [Ramlibacter tataouinensis]AEG93824.1 candidate ABC type nitrate/sulfonate/bicarbonate transport system, permease component [Ramlibacter tataouinensis TTB310]